MVQGVLAFSSQRFEEFTPRHVIPRVCSLKQYEYSTFLIQSETLFKFLQPQFSVPERWPTYRMKVATTREPNIGAREATQAAGNHAASVLLKRGVHFTKRPSDTASQMDSAQVFCDHTPCSLGCVGIFNREQPRINYRRNNDVTIENLRLPSCY